MANARRHTTFNAVYRRLYFWLGSALVALMDAPPLQEPMRVSVLARAADSGGGAGGAAAPPDKIVEGQNYLFAPPLFVSTERTKFTMEIAQRVKENFTFSMVAQ